MDPVLKINPAINLKGRYRLGQWNNPQTSYYLTYDSPGTDNAFSEGQWTMFLGPGFAAVGHSGSREKTLDIRDRTTVRRERRPDHGIAGVSRALGPLDMGIAFHPHRPARRVFNIPLLPFT